MNQRVKRLLDHSKTQFGHSIETFKIISPQNIATLATPPSKGREKCSFLWSHCRGQSLKPQLLRQINHFFPNKLKYVLKKMGGGGKQSHTRVRARSLEDKHTRPYTLAHSSMERYWASATYNATTNQPTNQAAYLEPEPSVSARWLFHLYFLCDHLRVKSYESRKQEKLFHCTLGNMFLRAFVWKYHIHTEVTS